MPAARPWVNCSNAGAARARRGCSAGCRHGCRHRCGRLVRRDGAAAARRGAVGVAGYVGVAAARGRGTRWVRPGAAPRLRANESPMGTPTLDSVLWQIVGPSRGSQTERLPTPATCHATDARSLMSPTYAQQLGMPVAKHGDTPGLPLAGHGSPNRWTCTELGRGGNTARLVLGGLSPGEASGPCTRVLRHIRCPPTTQHRFRQ